MTVLTNVLARLEQASAVPSGVQKLLTRFVRDEVDQTRGRLLKLEATIPSDYRTIKHPIYRGCSSQKSALQVLQTGAVIRDWPLASWSYDAKEAASFCCGSAKNADPGLLLVRRTAAGVFINMADNAKRFGPELRSAIDDYEQSEILVTAARDKYAPRDVAGIAVMRENFGYYNSELGWKLSAKFNGHASVFIVNPSTKPHILNYYG